MLISTEYKKQNKELHELNPNYGCNSKKVVPIIRKMVTELKLTSVLDYGCGKALLEQGLRETFSDAHLKIVSYDPCIEGRELKEFCELVVCTDVMEHVEKECVGAVLDEIAELTLKYAFFNICCIPSLKLLPDGRNTHISIRSPSLWVEELFYRFHITSFISSDNESFITAFCKVR